VRIGMFCIGRGKGERFVGITRGGQKRRNISRAKGENFGIREEVWEEGKKIGEVEDKGRKTGEVWHKGAKVEKMGMKGRKGA
jgi:hypothetical protein